MTYVYSITVMLTKGAFLDTTYIITCPDLLKHTITHIAVLVLANVPVVATSQPRPPAAPPALPSGYS